MGAAAREAMKPIQLKIIACRFRRTLAALAISVLALFLFFGFTGPLLAQQVTGLPIPRWVSLAAGEVNLRAGPGRKYPIEWVYKRHGIPVEITGEFEHWRKVRDLDGSVGWIHKSLLSGRRTVIVVGETRAIRKSPDDASPVVLRAEPGVQAELRRCRDNWCDLEIEGRHGWLRRTAIWGVYTDEEVN